MSQVVIFGHDTMVSCHHNWLQCKACHHLWAQIAEYNIMSASGNNLNIVLRDMQCMHIDFGLLTETKLTHDKYTKDCCGFKVFATKASSSTKGGVAFFYRSQSDLWSIEGLRAHGPNVISCTIVSGTRQWPLVGCYIAPSEEDGSTLTFVEEAVCTHCRHPLIHLNVNLHSDDLNHWDEDIVTALALLGLLDVAPFFLPFSW